MTLDIQKIKEITVGAVGVFEENGEIVFRRFTDEETRYYRIYRDEVYARKTYTTAGVRLAFETDSKRLAFSYKLLEHPWRPFGFFDVTVDGAIVLHEGIHKGSGEGQVDIVLKEGAKTVEIWFSWSKGMSLSDISLDDGATIVPKKRSRTMINYGDSITHGYDSIYPSLSYASQLASILDADAVNKAIGGDRFFSEILEVENGVESPDIVTVAYGTNDWSCHSRATVERRSREFYSALSKKYPKAKIFAVTPIWRTNSTADKSPKYGAPCTEVEGLIRKVTEGLSNVTVISGWSLTPHQTDFYSDGLHPNDLGMSIYAKNLAAEIGKYL